MSCVYQEVSATPAPDEHEQQDGEDCEHSFRLIDDIGSVCRICGYVQKTIESIIDFEYAKVRVFSLSNFTYSIIAARNDHIYAALVFAL